MTEFQNGTVISFDVWWLVSRGPLEVCAGSCGGTADETAGTRFRFTQIRAVA